MIGQWYLKYQQHLKKRTKLCIQVDLITANIQQIVVYGKVPPVNENI